MDELKKLIEDNRALLDSAEPSEGHFDKFKEMLMENDTKLIEETKIKRFNWSNLLRVASIAILVVLSGLYITERFIGSSQPTAKQNIEFKEAQQYYIQLVDNKINEIESLQSGLTDEQESMLLKEMTEMDELYKKLQDDYKAMPNDPRIIQALLQHYQMKMDILNRIINNLNNVQQLNTPNHENIEI